MISCSAEGFSQSPVLLTRPLLPAPAFGRRVILTLSVSSHGFHLSGSHGLRFAKVPLRSCMKEKENWLQRGLAPGLPGARFVLGGGAEGHYI